MVNWDYTVMGLFTVLVFVLYFSRFRPSQPDPEIFINLYYGDDAVDVN